MSEHRRPGLARITGYIGGVPTREQVVELVRGNARELGCTCDPLAVDVPENYGQRGAVARITAVHDDDCPVVAA